jgi:hypothetical protein
LALVKPEVIYVIECRTKDGTPFTQHVSASDVRAVTGKDGLRLVLKHHGKKITYPPGIWVSYRQGEEITHV